MSLVVNIKVTDGQTVGHFLFANSFLNRNYASWIKKCRAEAEAFLAYVRVYMLFACCMLRVFVLVLVGLGISCFLSCPEDVTVIGICTYIAGVGVGN